jgi:hypothetical protein
MPELACRHITDQLRDAASEKKSLSIVQIHTATIMNYRYFRCDRNTFHGPIHAKMAVRDKIYNGELTSTHVQQLIHLRLLHRWVVIETLKQLATNCLQECFLMRGFDTFGNRGA